ncbi:MAG TPA: hypothetical protein EYG70_04250 [Sulfurimonas sp.]|nr:hypothetical protein [Sulfurimonas sp.]
MGYIILKEIKEVYMKILLDKFNDKEYKLLNTHINKKGSEVNIEIASKEKTDMSGIDNNMFASATYGSSFLEREEENRKIIFINDSFEFKEINIMALLDKSNSFNSIYSLITGSVIPKNSVITFIEFPEIKLIVDKIESLRPSTTTYKYLLSRR